MQPIRSGRTLLTVTGLITVIVAGFFIVHILLNTPQRASARAMLVPDVTATDVEQTLFRIGITPERLAAAGVDSGDVITLVSAINTYLQTNLDDIQSADDALMLKRIDHDTLSGIVQSGLATSQQLDDFTEAQSEMSTAQTNLANELALVRDEANESLTAGEETLIDAMAANAQWRVPVEYCTDSRTEAEWVQLREALANERISPLHGDEPDGTLQSLLSTVRNDSPYINASTNLSVRLAGVTAAWIDALPEDEPE